MKDIKPEKCFSKDPKVRITMSDVKNYETKLKKRLVELASDDKYPKETEKLLNAFREKAKILEERQKKEEEEAAKAKEGEKMEPMTITMRLLKKKKRRGYIPCST